MHTKTNQKNLANNKPGTLEFPPFVNFILLNITYGLSIYFHNLYSISNVLLIIVSVSFFSAM